MSDRVLLVGSGGREHALAWKLAQSPTVSQIFAVPGNGGTAGLAPKVQNVSSVKADNFAGLLDFAVKENITLLVPGPEAPLVDGITDYFKEHGPARIKVFGPSKAAARMEGSKAFAKDFMKRHRIPTASYETFTDHAEAKRHLDSLYPDRSAKGVKVVIKASGLAAGKGVILPETYEQACATLSSIMLDKEFGEAGSSTIIEQYLEGEEISILSFSDGHTIRSLPAAQDHKRIHDGDQGGNTGGMGAYAPSSAAPLEIMQQIHDTVLQPTIDGMADEASPFIGCLFTGLMLTHTGPKVLEYNVRFGDPEIQTLLPLLNTDLATLMLACSNHHLRSLTLDIKPGYSTTVVVAAGGYPDKYAKGTPMTITPPAEDGITHFHAGTTLDTSSNTHLTSGGRVIASTALAPTIKSSIDLAYQGVKLISFDKMHYRTDIGRRELHRQSSLSTILPSKPHAQTKPNPLTYASTGVSITTGNTLVTSIKSHLARTARPGASAQIGGFGGTISLPSAGYPSQSPTLVAAIDGIGTKLLIALAISKYDTVGIDLVAMNVNDLVVQGAEPLGFLDYFACGRLDGVVAEGFVKGVAEGSVDAGCALVGGETAEMPGVYKVLEEGGDGKKWKSDFDAAGCAIGAIPAGKPILPVTSAMVAGDVLLGLASSGVHSNGFSLVRRIVERAGLSHNDPAPWEAVETGSGTVGGKGRTVGEALLEPTRIYVKSLLKALEVVDTEGGMGIKGMAHITGGGLVENIPRMLPGRLDARVEVGSWEVPAVLRWLKREGGLENGEFARTFNTGLGMVCVVGRGAVERVMKVLEGEGERVFRVGELVEGKKGRDGEEAEVRLEGLEKLDAM